ncbi:MAG: hypothetical protein HQM06_17720 [Magnetococcales bacterium]|nr:hypothetical protein [Magnetococcales bacterium]
MKQPHHDLSGLITFRLTPHDKRALQEFADTGFGGNKSDAVRAIVQTIVHNRNVSLFRRELIGITSVLRRTCQIFRDEDASRALAKIEPQICRLESLCNNFERFLKG